MVIGCELMMYVDGFECVVPCLPAWDKTYLVETHLSGKQGEKSVGKDFGKPLEVHI